MTVPVEDLERLGAGPLLSERISLYDDGWLHGADDCYKLTPPFREVQLSVAEVHERWVGCCSCLQMLSSAPPQLHELAEFRAIGLCVEGLAPVPLGGSTPRATVSVSRRLTSVESVLELLRTLSFTFSRPAKVCADRVSALEAELDELRVVYAAGLRAAIRVLGAVESAKDLFQRSALPESPLRDVLWTVAPVWKDLVADGVDSPLRLCRVLEALGADHDVTLLREAVAVLEERLGEYLDSPNLLAIVELPPRPPSGLYRLVADAFSMSVDGVRSRLMVLPAFALEFLREERGFVLRSTTPAPTDPVVLENAVAMWSQGTGPLGSADSLVSAAAAVQH